MPLERHPNSGEVYNLKEGSKFSRNPRNGEVYVLKAGEKFEQHPSSGERIVTFDKQQYRKDMGLE